MLGLGLGLGQAVLLLMLAQLSLQSEKGWTVVPVTGVGYWKEL